MVRKRSLRLQHRKVAYDLARWLSCLWLPDIAWLPEADRIAVDQLYRALDFLAVWSEEIEREVFLRAADLLRLDTI